MKTILTIIGARPQFIKAAIISRLIKDKYNEFFKEFIVHTGQHYDKNMSQIFFDELEIPKPDVNLNIGSASHGQMTGLMLIEIEKTLLNVKPDFVLVYGDTNSTLAGSLAATKLHIPIIHVEAGLRSFNKKMPEELNRILTDNISDFLFCPTQTAVDNLSIEGIKNNVSLVGDIMYDASIYYQKKIDGSKPFFNDLPNDFYLLTLHRAENTDDFERLSSIVRAINKMKDKNAVLPLHPRTKKQLIKFNLEFDSHIHIIEPVGFLEILELEKKCSFMMTDSGGMQKEAYFFKKLCITLRDQTEWIETVEQGWNTLVGADENKIINAIKSLKIPNSHPNLYGDGNTGEQILNYLLNK